MKFFTCSILPLFVLSMMIGSGCSSKSKTQDTETCSGEDSIAYTDNAVLQSPMSAEDLLALEEDFSVEDELVNYNNYELARMFDDKETFFANHRDSAAIRLANRFMCMAGYVSQYGDANDKLQWAVAVNAMLDTFRVAEPSVPSDSVLDEIDRVIERFSSQTMREAYFQSSVASTVDYYLTIDAYRRWLLAVPDDLKALFQEEYEAWHDLNEARFSFWNDVSSAQEWYPYKPMDIEGYYKNLSCNRRAELEQERDVVLAGKPYVQKGRTVTEKQWEQWIEEHSVPEDMDYLKEMDKIDLIPNDSFVAEHVNTLKSAFSRWQTARQTIAAALPKEKGRYYDNITSDIHSRMIGKLEDIIPYEKN